MILDPSTWPRWQPEILSASGTAPLSAGDVVRGEARMLGFVVHGHSTALEADSRVFDQDVIVGIRMRVRYEVDPDGQGSRITHQLTADLPSGVAGRVLSFFLRRRLRKLQRTTLQNLAAELAESG
jgi:Polyketide cyclase / dehydrase and lipid transport